MNRKALITSIKGTSLTNDEKKMIYNHKPWGIILFRRNIQNIKQLKQLTFQLRKTVNDPLYPILIDEEGGNVSRLSKIIDNKLFSQNFFGKLYEKNSIIGKNFYEEYLYSICNILNNTGININTIPVLDILKSKTHKIIGNRSYSKNLKTIKSLGNICIKILRKCKIGSVSKHIPGHGCSNFDTHKKLSRVNDSLIQLMKNDFSAFKNINSHFVMTAHIIYNKVDPINPATHSQTLIEKVIRKKLGFKGLIISDDISMKALSNNLLLNATRAVHSGCNLALYCNGDVKESSNLLKKMKFIDNFTCKKTSEFYRFLR